MPSNESTLVRDRNGTEVDWLWQLGKRIHFHSSSRSHWACVNVGSTSSWTMEMTSFLLITVLYSLTLCSCSRAVDVSIVRLWITVRFYRIVDFLATIIEWSYWFTAQQDIKSALVLLLVHFYCLSPSFYFFSLFCRVMKSSRSSKWRLSGRPGNRWTCEYHLLLFLGHFGSNVSVMFSFQAPDFILCWRRHNVFSPILLLWNGLLLTKIDPDCARLLTLKFLSTLC